MNYFDCHADTLTEISVSENLWENTGNLDLKRVRQFAQKYTQIFAIWKDKADIIAEQSESIFLKLYDRAVQLLQEQSESIVWCKNAADMLAAHKAGKAAAFLSIEDISIMGTMAERIRELGIRFAILTWNYENDYACGAVADQSKGLTKEGHALVKRLLEQQIILDISHLSDQGIEDLFHDTDQPVMASHSNVRDVWNHPRNLQTAHVKELIRRKGLMGLNFYEYFVGEHPRIDDLLRHVDAVLALGGEDILAIGSDFDGCENHFPGGITDVLAVPRLKALLEREGFGRRMAEKVLYGNAERFLVENVRG